MGIEGIGKAIDSFFYFCVFVLLPLAVLGIWKFIEIIIWCFKNISISFS